MKKEEINFYHGLGGVKGLIDTFDWFNRNYPRADNNILEPVLMYRMRQIFKCGYIYCSNLLENSPCMYNSDYDYDKNQVYIISDKIFNESSKENYVDWVALSTSFLVDIEKAMNNGIHCQLDRDNHSSIDHQIVIEKQLSTKYIKAVCVPIINRAVWDKLACKKFSLTKYLESRNIQIEAIKKILQEYEVNVPVIETNTFEILNNSFDFKERIEKSNRHHFGNFETFKRLLLTKKL